ncbi:hypothetical protein niasHS_007452 [Heterodera schachtii]|uniref:Uncharacterized protein n=1 Tax=Heterodera schachtii TaxID=97005 RepID=A0ABD2JXQ3_HETSC
MALPPRANRRSVTGGLRPTLCCHGALSTVAGLRPPLPHVSLWCPHIGQIVPPMRQSLSRSHYIRSFQLAQKDFGIGTPKMKANCASDSKKKLPSADLCNGRCSAERRIHCRELAKWGRQLTTLVGWLPPGHPSAGGGSHQLHNLQTMQIDLFSSPAPRPSPRALISRPFECRAKGAGGWNWK